MTVYIVFNKHDVIISIHKNREYAMQVAKDYIRDYIRTFGLTEKDLTEYLKMLAEEGYVDNLVWVEEYEVND